MRAVWGLAFLALTAAGCATTQQTREDYYRGFLGMTMADFSHATGLVPSDAYWSGDRRVFLVNASRGAFVQPLGGGQAMVHNAQCRMLIETEETNGRRDATAWTIRSLTANGPC